MADFTLLRPWWLILLFLPLIFVYIDFAKHYKLQNFIREDIINYLKPKKNNKEEEEDVVIPEDDGKEEKAQEIEKPTKTISEAEQKMLIAKPRLWKKFGWLMIPYIFAVIALCGPAISQQKSLFQSEENWVWAIDYSDSMLAKDIQGTSRYEKARYSLIELLNSSKIHRRISLVAFTSDSFLVSPLTDDKSTILFFLHELSPSIMPVKGSNPLSGLQKAIELLDREPNVPGNILLVLDDVKNEVEVEDLTKAINDCPYPVYIFSVGTAMGAPIMINNKYLTDKDGKTIMANSHLDLIQRVARDSDSKAFYETGGEAPHLEAMYEYQHPKYKLTEKRKYEHKDIGYYFMLISMIACLGFIKNYFFMIVFALSVVTTTLTVSSDALAGELTEADAKAYPNEYGYQLFTEEKYEEALKYFTNPMWKGNSYYKLGRYDKALQEYLIVGNDADAKYNIGNCFAHLGIYDDAIKAYNQALKLDRKHADASNNKTVILEFLRLKEEEKAKKQAIIDAQNNLDLGIDNTEIVLLAPSSDGVNILQRRLFLQRKDRKTKTPEQTW
ncbi:MAG: VWA domain-containing protein [Succinivibrionaceae bacterium]